MNWMRAWLKYYIYCRTYLIGRGVIPTHSIWVNLQCHLACSENTGHDACCRDVIDSCALKSVICFSDAGKNVKFWIKTRSRNSNFLASKHGSGFRIYINLYWNRYKDIKLELIVEGFFLFICIKLCNCMFNLIFNVITVSICGTYQHGYILYPVCCHRLLGKPIFPESPRYLSE